MSEATPDREAIEQPGPPSAVVARDQRASLAWLVLLGAAALAIGLLWTSWQERGAPIEIVFAEGHGLAVGDAVRHRGISVGTVNDVALSPDGASVVVRAEIDRAVAELAGAASRFWIVRPRVDLAGVGGLDTIVGPRYIEMRPEPGEASTRFVGIDVPPAVESIAAGDRRFVIDAASRGSLARGAGVYYRQVRVGTVLSVDLAADANSVEAEILVEAPFAPLVRARTRFFPVGAFEFGLSLEGLRTRIDSLETLLLGGIAFATPPDAGREAPEGMRFPMDAKPEDDWLEWRPSIPLAAMPEIAPIEAVPIRLSWNTGGLFSRERSRTGWGIATELGILAPRSLLEVPRGRGASWSIGRDGAAVDRLEAPADAPDLAGSGLAFRAVPPDAVGAVPAIALDRLRAPTAIEDVLVYAGSLRMIVPLPAARLAADGRQWRIDRSVRIAADLLGAPVVAVRDGAIVGVLVIEDDEPRVGLIPASMTTSPASGLVRTAR